MRDQFLADAARAEAADFLGQRLGEAQARAVAAGKEIRFSGARLGALTNHFCAASQDGFSLSPKGNVSACYEVFSEENPLAGLFFYGQPSGENGYTFDFKRLNRLRGQAVEYRTFCQGCFAKWSCGGDCYRPWWCIRNR